ncbi:type II secretion system F family protein [Caulobacter sp. NIBR2454]|uniref:type II secretion system F family protein n=1 Tax=Caulobacter sp. NIBR2454 TaxID=3015996 RepID=UPI0022B71EFF|nr:type II secretion system F family protein [Caulobacter sp. NIBR2454]
MADLTQLVEPQNLMAGFIAVLVFATVVTLTSPALNKSGLEGRLKSVAERRELLRRRSREALAEQAGSSVLRRSDSGIKKRVVDRLKLSTLLEDTKVEEKLAQAGLRGPGPVTAFYFFRFLTPLVLSGLAAFYVYGLDIGQLISTHKLAICVLALAAGYYAPNLYVTNRAQKRRDSIVLAFPDALDLLLICVESGMSVEAAVQKVAGEIGTASIELAEELTLLTAELNYLPDRRLAYEGLARRINHPGVKSVATAMIQAERYGTPLGAALRVMAKENREMRLSAAERKAAALPAKLTVPMILFFLPVLFVVILGPAIMKVQDILGKGG